jgi:hypothetical protein
MRSKKQLCESFAAIVLAGVGLSCPTMLAQGRSDNGHTRVEMKNIAYHFTPTVSGHVIWLDGQLAGTKPGQIPAFDDFSSFALQVQNAKMSIPADNLGGLMNQDIFDGPDAPLTHLAVGSRGDLLHITGRLHNRGDIPFSMDGMLSATSDGNIRIHAEKISALHIPVKGIMDLFGVKISDLMAEKKLQGIVADGDDLILDVEKILPPPQIRGRITRVQIEGNQIVATYGKGAPNKQGAGSYMSYRGGDVRFGKLTMTDADLTLLEMNPNDPFDFYPKAYKRALMAGYVKTTPNLGFRVYMRDFDKLGPEK